jgi:hypothetical protein
VETLKVTVDGITSEELLVRTYSEPTCSPGGANIWVGGQAKFSVLPTQRCSHSVEIPDHATPIIKAERTSAGFYAKGLNGGSTGVTVHVKCDDLEYGLPDAVCDVSVCEVTGIELAKSTDSSYVGSYVNVSAKLQSGCVAPLTSVDWKVDSKINARWKAVHDKSLLIQGFEEGHINVGLSVPEWNTHVAEVVYFDHALYVSPRLALLPPGATLQLEARDEKNQSLDAGFKSSSEGLRVSDDGVVKASNLGNYSVNVSYHTQWQLVSISVTDPAALFLEPIGAGRVDEHLVDADGQQYTTKEGTQSTLDDGWDSIGENRWVWRKDKLPEYVDAKVSSSEDTGF